MFQHSLFSVSINSFLAEISKYGGLATSNNFQVDIKLPGTVGTMIKEAKIFSQETELNDYIHLFCEEAQLPNINTATGQQNGLYVGMGSVDYIHTRIFTEMNLTFMLDANLSMLKFFNLWHSYMFGDHGTLGKRTEAATSFLQNSTQRPRNRTNRVAYKSDYASEIIITKTEQGPRGATERKPISYVLEQAYPYAIDAVPLQYGATQLTRLNVNFKYERYYTIHRDTRSIKDDIYGLTDLYSPDGFWEPGMQRPVARGPEQRAADLAAAQQFTGQQQLSQANANLG